MASQALEVFQAYMEAKEMNVEIPDEEGRLARLGFNLDSTTVEIFLLFGEDDKDVHFVGRDFVKIPADKQGMVYKLCNECNDKYRWVKFVWEEEHECVSVQADAVIEPETCAEECFEIVGRICGIIDDAYPAFMKAIWA